MSDAIYVVGHRNPDMDAIASALGYAWVLNQRGDGRYHAARTGQLNAQAEFALQHFKVEAPPLVTDVYTRVGDLREALPALRQGQSLLDACRLVAQTRRPAALLNSNDQPLGLISGAGLFAHMADALSSASVLALAKEFDLPADDAADKESLILQAKDAVRDVLNQALRSEQDDFLIVDEEGRYQGLCRKSALLSAPRRRVVLVDHNEPGQAVQGIEEALVVEVLDHHRLGNVPTAMPIRFTVDTVGSCSTLVAERAEDSGAMLPAPLAGVLLCGILSDTLIFKSPTTTPRDERAALFLARAAQLAPREADEAALREAIHALGQKLLMVGAGLGTRPAAEIISQDVKFYEANGYKVGVSQVEINNFSELVPRIGELHAALREQAQAQQLDLALLMVTNIVHGHSRLLVEGNTRLIAALPYARRDDDTLDAPDMMSRKKQLLPTVLAVLSNA
jgi:manganese-dependent inorganic pyrophosphatase